MLIRAAGFLAMSLNVVAIPAGAQQRLDFSLAPPHWATSNSQPPQRSNDSYYNSSAAQNQHASANGRDLSMDVQTESGAPGKISMGSVGSESTVGGSYQVPTGDNRYSSSGAGFRLKIPIENDKSP